MGKTDKRTCYRCKEKKVESEMTLMGVWICNKCIKSK